MRLGWTRSAIAGKSGNSFCLFNLPLREFPVTDGITASESTASDVWCKRLINSKLSISTPPLKFELVREDNYNNYIFGILCTVFGDRRRFCHRPLPRSRYPKLLEPWSNNGKQPIPILNRRAPEHLATSHSALTNKSNILMSLSYLIGNITRCFTRNAAEMRRKTNFLFTHCVN